MRRREVMRIERSGGLQDDRRASPVGVAVVKIWSDSGVGWMMNRVSWFEYNPVKYACQSALIW